MSFNTLEDIDWFVILNERLFHVASNGFCLPTGLYTPKEREVIFAEIMSLSSKSEVEINRSFVKTRSINYDYVKNIEEKKQLYPEFVNRTDYPKNMDDYEIAYSWSFVEMAKRGCFSYDTINEDRCCLVASPKEVLNQHDLPNNIYSLLRHIKVPSEKISRLDELDLVRLINE